MNEMIRCRRRNLGRFVAISLSLVLAPAALGGLILWFFSGGILTWSLAVFCFLAAIVFLYPALKMYEWVETDGLIVRGRRFWTRLMVEHSARDLAELRVSLAQSARHGRDPAAGAIGAFHYQLMFRDRSFIFLSRADMTDADAFVEQLLPDPVAGFAMPLVVGAACLGGMVDFGEAALGRSYAYYGQGHLIVTVYVYDGEYDDHDNDAAATDGIDSPALREEFEESLRVAEELRASESVDPPRVAQTIARLGEDADGPQMLAGSFEFELDGDTVESRLYLFRRRGRTIKLRCTMPASYRNIWGPGLSRFETELGRLLR